MNLWEQMTGLAACVCALLEDEDRPVCWCGILPGEPGGVPADKVQCKNGKCGMAWTRPGLTYPATQVGIVDQNQQNCGSALGMDVEVGILRCHKITKEGALVDPEQAAADQHTDMMLLHQAVRCCDALNGQAYVLGSFTPIGPMGATVGGTWMLHLLDV